MNVIFNPLFFMLAKFSLAFVLIAAAIPKLRERDEFHGVVANYRILPESLSYPFARMLPWVELACAVLFLVNLQTVLAGLATAVLMLAFSVAIGINIARGRTHIDCGCLRGADRGNGIGFYQFVRPLMFGLAALYVAHMAYLGTVATPDQTMLALAAAVMTTVLYLGADRMSSLSPAGSNNS